MGLFDRFRKKSKIGIEKRMDLVEVGILVTGGDELDKRIDRRKEFHENILEFGMKKLGEDGTPEEEKKVSEEEKILGMGRRLVKIDRLLKEVSVPWGRAGSEKWFRDAMIGWEGLFSKSKAIVAACYEIALISSKKHIDKGDVVRKLRRFLWIEVIRFAQYIEDVSFFEKDVSPKYNLVIQQAPAQSSGYGANPPQPRTGSLAFPQISKREEDEKS